MLKSSRPIYWIAATLPLFVLPAIVLLSGSHWPAWIFMWLLAGAVFYACKWLSLLDALRHVSQIPKRRIAAFLLLWPGMDAAAFLSGKKISHQIPRREWSQAALKMLVGGMLFWLAPRFLPFSSPLLVGWVGMLGLILMLHFGGFELIALFWRSWGFQAESLMNAPILSRSLEEFWGKRWNRGFRQLAHRFFFQPLRPLLGVSLAGFSVFFVSGIIHDLVISIPARGGYGLPTAYFVFQGLGVTLQRSAWARNAGLGQGWKGWIMTMLWTGGPAYFLFHPPFVLKVIVPMMQALGAFES